MDIANYIGLFLLKNKFCYVHGLGNMELKKVPATHDGQTLQAPSYQVVVTPGGSIDDNLANFIATNEQISISKAANSLREYSIQARKELAEGKEVPIPNIGKFTEKNGKITFVTDSNFSYTPAGIPTIRNSKQLEEQNARPIHKPSYPPPTKADAINWSVVILVAVLLLIVAGGGYGIYYYMHQRNETTTTTPNQDTVAQAPLVPLADTAAAPPVDSTTVTQPATDSNQLMAFRMVIGSYKTKARADQRVEKLALSKIPAEVVGAADSTAYMVITTVNARLADTAHVKDSLVRFYGYKGVMIY
jgi:nucleoid DNA-binding protein